MQKMFGVMVLPFIMFALVAGTMVYAAADNVSITVVSPQLSTADYGNTDSVVFEITAEGIGEGEVTWNATGLPTGATATFYDNPSIASGTWVTTLTITTSPGLDPDSYPITITATGDGVGGTDSETLTFTVDPKQISIDGLTAEDKEYDSTEVATLSGTLTDIINSDNVSATGLFTTDDIGVDKDVDVTLTGPDADKYLISGQLSADITAKDISIISGDFATNGRAYDGTTVAELRPSPTGLTLAGVVPGDSVQIVGGSGELADKHIGTAKTVTFSGFVAGGTDGANYNLIAQPVNETQNINKRQITVRPQNDTKVYDGTTTSALTPTVTLGSIATGDTANFTQTFGTEFVGTGKTILSAGTVDDGNGGGNYIVTHNPRVLSEITPLALTVENLPVNTKIYDKTTTATLGTGATLAGVIGLDEVYPEIGGADADFIDSDSGAGKTVNVTGITLSGPDAFNYTVDQPTLSGDITPRPISITATTASKDYDGTTTAAGAAFLSGGTIVFGDTAIFSQEFADKQVGTGKTIIPIIDVIDGNSGNNYEVSEVNNNTGVINAIDLAVTAIGVDKVYDGTTEAEVTYSDDRVSGDDLTVTGTANFEDENVGVAKNINITGITLSGPDALNYVPNANASATASITERTLNITIVANDRVYNRTREATITILDDRISGDDLTVTYPITGPDRPIFGGRNVANNKTVSVSGLGLTGPDALNYSLATLSGSDNNVAITPAPLTIAFLADNKTYDATTTTTILSSSISTPLFGGDIVALDGGVANFLDKQVGTGKTVAGSGFNLIGESAFNYYIATTTPTVADITAVALSVTATGIDKVYDATTTASVTYSDNRLGSDDLTVTGTANFIDKNIGVNKLVNVTGITLSGPDALNYTANATTSATADIDPRDLTVTVSGIDKNFDGATTASVNHSDDRLAGDSFTITSTANFDDSLVGTGKLVTATAFSLTGSDSANYTPNATATTTASIIAVPTSNGGGSSSGSRRRVVDPAPTGAVLGASSTASTTIASTTATTSFQFLTDLSIGMTSSDVTELQKVLMAKGFLQIPAPTGYFGPLTLEAVKRYQAANSIITTGYVGPLTRGALNAGR